MKEVSIFIAGLMLIGMVGVGIAGEMASSSDIVTHEIHLSASQFGPAEIVTVKEDLSGLTMQNSSVSFQGREEILSTHPDGGSTRKCHPVDEHCWTCENCEVISRIPG